MIFVTFNPKGATNVKNGAIYIGIGEEGTTFMIPHFFFLFFGGCFLGLQLGHHFITAFW